MKTFSQKPFKVLVLIAGIFTGAIAFGPGTPQESLPDFTYVRNIYRTTISPLAKDSSSAVRYDKREIKSAVRQPPLNIFASYIFLRARPDETFRKTPAKGQKTGQRNLFVHLIRSIF